MLGAPESDQRRVRRIGNIEYLEVTEFGFDRRRDVIEFPLGKQKQVMDAKVRESEAVAQQQVDIIGLNARQVYGISRIVNIMQ